MKKTLYHVVPMKKTLYHVVVPMKKTLYYAWYNVFFMGTTT
jgi:hypothetical protein